MPVAYILNAPNDTQSEPLVSFSASSVTHLLELIQYPQRYGLERLLTEV